MLGLAALALAALALVLPVVSAALAWGARVRARALERRVEELEDALAGVRQEQARLKLSGVGAALSGAPVGLGGARPAPTAPAKVGSSQVGSTQAVQAAPAPAARSAPVEASSASAEGVSTTPERAPAPVEAPSASAEGVSTTPVEAPAAPAEAPAAQPQEPPPTAPRAARPRPLPEGRPARPPSAELLGTWLFAGLGGLFALIAGLLFFNYALDQGWFGRLGPAARFGLGVFAGLGALAAEAPLHRRQYRVPAAAVAGAGVGVLYGALYAGRSLYELYSQPMAFLGMSAVTVVAVLLAWRRDSQFLAALGLAGGLLTPVLLSTGENRAVALFGYLLLLNLGVLLASVRRGWWLVPGLVALGTGALHLGWGGEYGAYDQIPVGVGAALAFSAVYGAFAWSRVEQDGFAAVCGAASAAQPLAILPLLVPHDLAEWQPLTDDAVLHRPSPEVWALPLALVVFAAWGQLLGRRLGAAAWVCSVGAVALGAVVFGLSWADALAALAQPPDDLLALVGLGLVAPLVARRVAEWLPGGDRSNPGWSLPLDLLAVGGGLALTSAVLDGHGSVASAGVLALAVVALSEVGVAAWAPLAGVLAAAAVAALGSPGALDEGSTLPLAGAAFGALALYSALPLLPAARDRGLAPYLASALAGPLLYLPLHLGWRENVGRELLGLVPLLVGGASLPGAVHLRRVVRVERDDRRFALFIVVATSFACAAVPVQLSQHWLVLGWAAQSAALASISRRLTWPGVRVFSAALAGAVCGLLLLDPRVIPVPAPDVHPLFNVAVGTWLVATMALAWASQELAHADRTWWGLPVPGALWLSSIGAAFGLLNVVVAFAFAEEGMPRFAGGTLTQEMIRSLTWAGFGGALLGLGVWVRSKPTRLVAMAFLLLAAMKVFLVDLSNLTGMFRVGSVLGAGLTLLASAILLQRVVLRERTDEPDPEEEDRP